MGILDIKESSQEKDRCGSRKSVGLLLFLSWLVYTVGNVGRLNYSASMVAIIDDIGATKSEAGLVASFFFFAYGFGQLVNGLLCHKYNTRIVVFCSLIAAASANIGLPLCRSVGAMKWIWLLNGAVQSVLWSSLVKLQSECLDEKGIEKGIIVMSTTTAAGTFIAYGLSALNIAIFSWRVMFYIGGGLLAICSVAWLFGIGYVQKNLSKYEIKKTGSSSLSNGNKMRAVVIVSLCFVLMLAALNGFVRDGINTWVPSLLKEVYGIPAYFSVILTLILPLISVLGAYVAKLVYVKLKNDILVGGIFFAFGGVFCGLILWLYQYTLGLTVAMFAIVAFSMSAVQNVITSAVPFRLRTVGQSGFFAGVINASCYVGSTLTSFILGGVADSVGWNMVMIILLVLTSIGSVCAFLFSPYWGKRITPLL